MSLPVLQGENNSREEAESNRGVYIKLSLVVISSSEGAFHGDET
jgi:hypothetical protein